MQITNDIFISYFLCPRKAYNKLQGVKGEKIDLEKLKMREAEQIKQDYIQSLDSQVILENVSINKAILNQDFNYLVSPTISDRDFLFSIDLLEKLPSKSNPTKFTSAPIFIVPFSTDVLPAHKILLAGICERLNQTYHLQAPYGKILHGKNLKSSRVQYKKYLGEYYLAMDKLTSSKKPDTYLNYYCQACEFQRTCKNEALEEDHLSLLNKIPKKKISDLNRKGIFTVNQLSYTFRPARKTKKKNVPIRRIRAFSLQALSIREKKVHVLNSPKIPHSKVSIYIDIEGIPEISFHYLIGLKIVDGDNYEEISLWADSPEDEKKICLQLLGIVSKYPKYTMYHYGSYEISYFNVMKRRLPDFIAQIEEMIASCFNVLEIVYHKVYFPTYSNGLKEIANYLSFEWSDKKASGLQSIYWRKVWESSREKSLKKRLLTYNLEDCEALRRVCDFLLDIISEKDSSKSSENVIYTENLAKKRYTSLNDKVALPEMGFINECAYFDYQREKVHARRDKQLKRALKKKGNQKKSLYQLKVNRIINIEAKECPKCVNHRIKSLKSISKKIIDISFSSAGLKRWVVEYHSDRYYCRDCKHQFTPSDYQILKSRRVGHGFISWVMYQYVVNGLSYRKIETDLHDLFAISISSSTIRTCRDYFVDFYENTYNLLIQNIIKGKVVYADETPFALKYEKGYVWVFTNNRNVISFYKSNREGQFLKPFLRDFKGVLVSDFYNAYDSLNCRHQRCLIHLMRDLNDDLIKNPFNEEFKRITKDFTRLLQEIVLTIDQRGLSQYYLNKHIKSANVFLSKIKNSIFKTELAQSYQKRILKNEKRLFEFLNHDGISWNNNDAEHAIKILKHTNKNTDSFHSSGIDNYLKIVSIYQTCRNRNISFLKFLLSKETNLDIYCEKLLGKRKK